MNTGSHIAVFSKGILKNSALKKLLSIDQMSLAPSDHKTIDYVVGWGRKKNTEKAREYAKKNALDYYCLEDGFIHSMGQGVLGDKSCSLVKDGKGIYYDATQASDLEDIILNYSESSENNRVEDAISKIINSNISKYNNGAYFLEKPSFTSSDNILVIDQTAGDMSLEYGYANKQTFDDMLQAAITENPKANIIIKTHPDVIAGKKKGGINLSKIPANIRVISKNINPISLLKKIDKVYVVTSQMGFEALMLKKEVVCFGVPFYAGWGLTDDRADKNLAVWGRRNKKRTVKALFEAAYIDYTKYIHPDTQLRCSLEDVLSYFELQNKNQIRRALSCISFTHWKRGYIQSFLGKKNDLLFVSSISDATKKGFNSNSQLVTWASKNQIEVEKIIEKWGGVPWYVEDGFIRSTGLGTDLTAPASLVLDKTGIYYDPTVPSDLEKTLQNKEFSADEVSRADALKQSLLDNELSKYNLGSAFDKNAIKAKQGQKIILVPGQVEDDASIKKGCVDINTNSALIKAVRDKQANAYLIYKPHPDVVSGNRKGKVSQSVLDEYCDLVLYDASITDCLAIVDEVHTMTSLVGFEGLMRDLKVVCYGQPFYSSWGLTEDYHPIERRTRKLKLNELVAATLIDYPLYINWQTGNFTTPEVIVAQIKKKIDAQGGKQSNQVFWGTRRLRKLKNIIKGFLT